MVPPFFPTSPVVTHLHKEWYSNGALFRIVKTSRALRLYGRIVGQPWSEMEEVFSPYTADGYLAWKDWNHAMASFIKRFEDAVGRPGSKGLPDDQDFYIPYPAIWEYLTLSELDGKGRETATLLFFVDTESGRWKACLNDRDSCMVSFHTGDTFAGLLDAVERSLREGAADWRKQRQGKKRT